MNGQRLDSLTRRRRRRAYLGAALLTLLAAAACAPLPIEPARSYTNAFEQVRNVTEILLTDFENAQKAVGATPGKTVAQRFPASFEPQEYLSGARGNSDVAARRAALEAVSRYNEALLGLAEGRSVQSAKVTVAGLVSLAAMFNPTIGIAGGLASEVAGAVERARTRAEFVAAYRQAVSDDLCAPPVVGSAQVPKPAPSAATDTAAATKLPSCGPIIPAIFVFLIEDTRNYYQARVVLAEQEMAASNRNIRTLLREIEDLTGGRAAPAPGSAQAAEYQTMAADYQRLTAQLLGPDGSRSFRSGSQTYDQGTHAALTIAMTALRRAGDQDKKVVDDLNAYHARLGDYVRLLDRTQTYLADIGTALSQPIDVDAATARLVDVGIGLRRDSIDLQGAFLKLLASG